MKYSNRTMYAALVVALLAGSFGAAFARDTGDMLKARKAAAWQQRRIMYNDDGNHVRPYTTPDELIDLRLRQLVGTQVDTISYCTGGGGLFWGHQAQVGEVLGEFVTKNDNQYVKGICSSLEALKEQGTDPLTAAVDFGHANGMEVFWSYRMNNIEDSFAAPYLSRWKREHPEYLLGKAEDYAKYPMTDPHKWWAALDFAEQEVRDYMLRIFEDVFTRYDIDGIDMDWFRHPRFFAETTEEEPVTPEHIAIMNDFVRKVHALTVQVSADRGHPLLISCRVPLSVERCLAIGLDVPTWLEEGLVDILVFGGDLGPMAMAPQLQKMVELAHQYNVPALANIGGSGLQPNTGYYTEEAWWAAATNAWHAGVDGIYTFNLFPTEPRIQYNHIGSPDTLKGLDKLYAIDPVLPKDFWGFDRSALVVPDRLPIELDPEKVITAKLPVGEDIADNAPAGKIPHVLLRLRYSAIACEELRITLNGKEIGIPTPATELKPTSAPTWFELVVQPEEVQVGMNIVGIELLTNCSEEKKSPMDRLELVVEYRANGNRDYTFRDRMSREVLENYLSRAMTNMDLLTGRGDIDENIRMLKNTGVKFAGRTVYRWGSEQHLPNLLVQAQRNAEKVHAADPEIILQAGAFEIVTTQVNKLKIPAKIFELHGLPPEDRTFNYEAMIYPDGHRVDHWHKGASVPDMSQLETQLWFLYLAVSYIDIGCEAIHIGQVEIMDDRDEHHTHWYALLAKIRAYAKDHARRGMVLIDAHVPAGGIVRDGDLLFDFHSFPLRIKNVPDKPQQGILEVGHVDSIYGRSKGGKTYSGWHCDALPYLVELDNFGSSGHEGENWGSHWAWGYDEICWFANQPQAYQNEWLHYAWNWLKENDPNGFLQMPGSRCLARPPEGKTWYFANTPGVAAPEGFGQEETIKAIWAADR